MTTPQKGMQLFGGDWTQRKLEVLGKYLKSYATALKNQSFEKFYIDAFAGTGYREQRTKPSFPEYMYVFDDGLGEPEPQEFLDGSATIALKVEPTFDGYIFIESKQNRVKELEKLKATFPSRAGKIDVRHKDANDELQKICANWNVKRHRGVLFLDPFGLQVDWKTVQAVAQTQCLDTWILFPFSINRLLTRFPDGMPPIWRNRLSKLFGTEDWFQRFYQKRPRGFFDEPSDEIVIEKRNISVKGLGAFYHERLREIFTAVASTPYYLRNKNGAPLFQLLFAVGNEKGAPIALKIAEHIMGSI